MNHKQTAQQIVQMIGGEDNVNMYTHCVTRLRFILKDKSLVDEAGIKAIDGILGVVDRGGQFQIVIGGEVERVFNELPAFLPHVAQDKPLSDDAPKNQTASVAATEEKKSPFQAVMSYISASIAPTIVVIVACGLLNAILAITVQLGLDPESSTVVTLRSFTQIGFTYLPVWLAVSAARYLKTDSFIAAFLSVSCIVVFSNLEGVTLFGLTVPTVNYGSAIVPVLLMVPVLSVLDRFLAKHLHKNLTYMFKPLLCSVIMLPLILFVFGPVGALVGTALVNFCLFLMDFGPLSMAALAALHPITVIFGMHSLFTPILVNELASYGVTYVLCRALAANFAMAGAALGVGLRAKKAQNKSLGISASITALLAATEPALYGVLIPFKRPLIAACAAAGVAGIAVGVFQVHAYSMGSFNLFTLAYTIGGDSMTNFYIACGCAALAFVLGVVFAWLFGIKEED